MNLSKNYNLKASSLLESVIATTIIAICIYIASLVYASILKADYDLSYYKAKHKVEELYMVTVKEQLLDDENYDFDDFQIEKIVNDYNAGMKEIEFNIKTKSKKTTIKYLLKFEE